MIKKECMLYVCVAIDFKLSTKKYNFLQQVCLKPGTLFRDIFENIPFSLDFKVFIFNVTNPEAVQAGEYPVVQEVGPFVYA